MSDGKILEAKPKRENINKFIEGVDYYFEDGYMVLKEVFLLKRGYCCGNGCRHCPYPKTEAVQLQEKSV